MALLHTASMVMKIRDPIAFDNILNKVINFKFQENSALHLYQEMYVNVALRVLETCDKTIQTIKAITVLKNIKGRTYEMQKDIFNKNKRSDVITHGDLWSNNLMYNELTKDMSFIDLQLMIYTSVAADLSYFFYICLSVSTRKMHYKQLLKEYLKKLQMHLDEYSVPSVEYTYDWLHNEMHEFKLYGFMSCLWMLPVFYLNKADLNSSKIENVMNEDYMFNNISSAHKEHLVELVLDYTESFEYD